MILLPVRCWTCGKLLCSNDIRVKYVQLLQRGKTEREALDECGVHKYCCRRMLLSHVEISEEILSHCRQPESSENQSTIILPLK
jgi:DNA-directed RNA polymerase subunit N (RpoN/RPB10)